MLYHGKKLELEYDINSDDVQIIVGAWTVDANGTKTALDLTDDDVANEVYLIDTKDTLRMYYGLKE